MDDDVKFSFVFILWKGILPQMALLSLLFIAILATGCTESGAPQKELDGGNKAQPATDTFRFASIFEPKDMHPMSGLEAAATVQIYRYLAHAEWKAEQEMWDRYLDLLTLYEISPDGKQCRIYIRKDVYFHNGELMTADDVAYSLARAIKASQAQKDSLNVIVNTKIEVLSPHSLRMTSDKKEPWESFFSNPILNAKYEKKWEGKDLSKYVPMGTGPYKFVSYDSIAKKMKLDRFDQYYNGPSRFPHLEIRYYDSDEGASMALMDNSVDYYMMLNRDDVSYIRTKKKFTIFEMASPHLIQVFLNTRTPQLSDWRVRRALSLLIDRKVLVTDVNSLAGEAVATDAPFYNVNPRRKPTVSTGDAPQALRLLAEAGWTMDDGALMKNGERFKIELIFAEHNRKYLPAIRTIVSKWNEAGILCSIQVYKVDEWRKLASSGNYTATFTDFPEPLNLLTLNKVYLSNGEMNWSGYSDPELDELFHELQKPEPYSLNDVRAKAQIIIREKAPMLALFYPKLFGGINNDFALDDKILKEPFGLYFIGNK